jgi:hypothetical protein
MECLEGDYKYERVGTWVNGDKTYVVGQNGETVDFYNVDGLAYEDTIKTTEFSTKLDDQMISNEGGNINIITI